MTVDEYVAKSRKQIELFIKERDFGLLENEKEILSNITLELDNALGSNFESLTEQAYMDVYGYTEKDSLEFLDNLEKRSPCLRTSFGLNSDLSGWDETTDKEKAWLKEYVTHHNFEIEDCMEVFGEAI